MLKQLKNRKQEGFTIIEVLIVLAIAGLILLIVFLAVPALQRNARNTGMKSDVQSVLGGFSDFSGANNGAMAGSVSASNGTVTYQLSATTTGNKTSIKIQGATSVTTVTAAPTTAPTPGSISLVLKATCSTATGGSGTTSNRAVAAYYAIETSSGNVLQCSDS